MRNKLAIAVMALILFGLAGLLLTLPKVPSASASDLFAPTPITIYASGVRADPVGFFAKKVLTQTSNSPALTVADHEKADVQVVLDKTAAQTVTLKLQFSNDGLNWVDGATIGNALVADTNTLVQHALFGRFARVNAALTSANPVTITVAAVAK